MCCNSLNASNYNIREYSKRLKAKMSLMDLTNSKHFGVHRNSSYEPDRF